MTSALVGARTVEQLADTLKSLDKLGFSVEELRSIDRYATEGKIDIWKESSSIHAQ